MKARVARTRARRLLVLPAALLSAALLAGCGPVHIDSPKLGSADAKACQGLTDDLPATLADEKRVESEPDDAYGAAYGDPPIIVTCGVDSPAGWNRASQCEVGNGVGWYMPDRDYEDQSLDITMTTAGYRPRLEVQLPAEYRPNGIAAVMSDLSQVVKDHLRLVMPCR